MTAPQTVIVVPCYNEEHRLEVDAFHHFASEHEHLAFLFVNDGSTDATGQMLESLSERLPDRLRALQLERNRGKAEAVRAGFTHAFGSHPRYIGFWDADLATPLSDITTFIAILEQTPQQHAVFGSRVNLLGREVRRNLMRHYVGRVFATLAATVLYLPIYDTQCGAKLFRVSDQLRNAFAEPFLSRWIFDVEIIARMRAQWPVQRLGPFRDSVYEHPLMVWRDVAGSKLKASDFFLVGMDLLRIAMRYRSAIRARARDERRIR